MFDATSISIKSAPTSSSGRVRLRHEKSLVFWGNAILSLNALGLLRDGLYGIAYATAAKTVAVVKHMQPPL